MNATIFVTQTGYQNIINRISEKQKEYDIVRENRQLAFELSGDGWHDNPEFNRMQQMEANLNHTIKELNEYLAKTRQIAIHDTGRNTQSVAIGSIVKLAIYDLEDDTEREEIWEIRGFDETNPQLRHLAYNAPLAKHIIGLEAGDFAEEIMLGNKQFDVEVIEFFATREQANLTV